MEFFISQWSTEISFEPSSGEVDPSLKDVVVLTSLPLFIYAHAMRVTLEGKDQRMLDFLNKVLCDSKYSTNKDTYLSWVKIFNERKGRNNKLQVKALLGYWLSYFVLLSFPEDGLQS